MYANKPRQSAGRRLSSGGFLLIFFFNIFSSWDSSRMFMISVRGRRCRAVSSSNSGLWYGTSTLYYSHNVKIKSIHSIYNFTFIYVNILHNTHLCWFFFIFYTNPSSSLYAERLQPFWKSLSWNQNWWEHIHFSFFSSWIAQPKEVGKKRENWLLRVK